jgi:hypothetical protein
MREVGDQHQGARQDQRDQSRPEQPGSQVSEPRPFTGEAGQQEMVFVRRRPIADLGLTTQRWQLTPKTFSKSP